ncbi:MAG TPA: HAMP domain-containing sensor histidine kinase [Candidatus Binatia bacterium]|nr:HAMP domain-containing sensor histidine kinase [Candidatus Binatia bacterium]
MAEDRPRGVERNGTAPRDGRRRSERFRDALAQVEEQRDDAVVYLSAIKSVLDVLARGHGTRQCGQAVAETLVRQLAVETCAIAIRDRTTRRLGLVGFATQAQRLGGPSAGLGETGWLALAELIGPGARPACFRRKADGSFEAVGASDLLDEGFLVLPFRVGDEAAGALVLHSLVAPAQIFARARALALIADIVGQALTVAGMRESVQALCTELEAELGVTRQRLSMQQESLRAQEENIETLTKDLIRSNRVKRDFLGTVSHELRTPLNAILGYTSLVREGLVGTVTDEQSALLDRVLNNTRNLNALIDDMLFFVQVEADRVLVKPDTVATAELVAEVVSAIPERATKPEVALRVDVAPEAERLNADPALLRRLLFHLLGNAFKFTPAGEVTVSVQAGEEIGGAVIAVADTGVGIPPERVKEMFDLFAQGDASTTRRYNGLGMGLTLVQRCVRLLGGEVLVESRPEGGTEFRVRLPGALADGALARDAVSGMPSRAVH